MMNAMVIDLDSRSQEPEADVMCMCEVKRTGGWWRNGLAFGTVRRCWAFSSRPSSICSSFLLDNVLAEVQSIDKGVQDEIGGCRSDVGDRPSVSR